MLICCLLGLLWPIFGTSQGWVAEVTGLWDIKMSHLPEEAAEQVRREVAGLDVQLWAVWAACNIVQLALRHSSMMSAACPDAPQMSRP